MFWWSRTAGTSIYSGHLFRRSSTARTASKQCAGPTEPAASPTFESPPPATVRIEEETAPLLQVFVEGQDIRVLSPVAEYMVGPPDRPAAWHRIRIDYGAREQEVENGWKVVLNMIVDYEQIRYIVHGQNLCRQAIALDTLKVHVLVGDAAWDPPGGAFDPNIVSVPDAMTNVQNGFGFVGGGYRLSEALFPSRDAVEKACFIYVW